MDILTSAVALALAALTAAASVAQSSKDYGKPLTLRVTTLTQEQAIEQAKEMHNERGTMAKFDPSKYTGPVNDVQITGEGARIR